MIRWLFWFVQYLSLTPKYTATTMPCTHCLPRPQKVCQTLLGLGMRIVLWDFLAMLTANADNNKYCIVKEMSERQKQKWKNVYMLSKEAKYMYFVKINIVYGMEQFKVLNQVVQWFRPATSTVLGWCILGLVCCQIPWFSVCINY